MSIMVYIFRKYIYIYFSFSLPLNHPKGKLFCPPLREVFFFIMPRGSPWSPVVRAATTLLINEGYKNDQVQRLLWEQFHNDYGWKDPPSIEWIKTVRRSPKGKPASELKKRGRKTILNDKHMKTLTRLLRYNHKEDRWYSPSRMAQELQVECSGRTIRRALHSIPGARARKPRKVLLLNVNQRKKRLAFSKRGKGKSVEEYWRTVTYMDEKKCSLSGPDSEPPVWTLGEKRAERKQHASTRLGVMIWGAIGPEGLLGPKWIEGTLTSKDYINILEEYEEDISERIMDDGAGAHRGRIISEYMEEVGVSRVCDELGDAPKLVEVNIIENVWPMLERRAHKAGRVFESNEELFKALYSVADDMRASGEDVKMYERLTRTIPRRLQAIEAAKGGGIEGKKLK